MERKGEDHGEAAPGLAAGGDRAGCGGREVEEAGSLGIQKIRPSNRVYTLDDLTSFGFKKARTYDVKALPEAVNAHYGF